MEYYSAITWNKALMPATVELEAGDTLVNQANLVPVLMSVVLHRRQTVNNLY